jgi:AcrR family transcriptional regulator
MRLMGEPVKAADGRRDRWTAHREERRGQFVAAALRVLATHGPDLPMDAVAAEAKVTKPILYRYFADKTELVAELGQFGSDLLLARLLPAIAAELPARQRVQHAVGAYYSVIDENPNLYWLLVRHSASGDGTDEVGRNKQLIASRLTEVLNDYLRVFGLDAALAEPWAHGVTGLVQATGEWWLSRRPMGRDQVVTLVTDMIWAAFTGALAEAGIAIDPDQPLPLPLMATGRAEPGDTDG